MTAVKSNTKIQAVTLIRSTTYYMNDPDKIIVSVKRKAVKWNQSTSKEL